jgi:hypothetical protein
VEEEVVLDNKKQQVVEVVQVDIEIHTQQNHQAVVEVVRQV